MPALNVLLDSLVDYAGLFPPAQLVMDTAVADYTGHLRGPHRAHLGRFIFPLARLTEFETALANLPPPSSTRAGPKAMCAPSSKRATRRTSR